MNFVGQELDRTPGENLSLIHYVWVLSWETWDWCWHHLQVPSRTYLGVGAGCHLGASAPLHMGISMGSLRRHSQSMVQGCKGRHPKRENARRRLYHFLWPILRSVTALFPPQSIHQKQGHIQEEGNQTPPVKVLGAGDGRELDLLWKIKYLFIWIIFKITNYLYIYYMNRLEASISLETFLSIL